jgi:hypothetical protein
MPAMPGKVSQILIDGLARQVAHGVMGYLPGLSKAGHAGFCRLGSALLALFCPLYELPCHRRSTGREWHRAYDKLCNPELLAS